jgi:hypothetical protein
MKLGFLLTILLVIFQSHSEHVDLGKRHGAANMELVCTMTVIRDRYEVFDRIARAYFIKQEVMKSLTRLIEEVITGPESRKKIQQHTVTLGEVNQMLYEISKKISIMGDDEKFDASETKKSTMIVFIDSIRNGNNSMKSPFVRYVREEDYDSAHLKNSDTTTFFQTMMWALRSIILNKEKSFPAESSESGRKYFEGRSEEQIKKELQSDTFITNMALLWGLEGLRTFCLILAHCGANPLEENNPFNELLRLAQNLNPDPDLIIDRIQATMPEKGNSSWLLGGIKGGVVLGKSFFGAIAHLGSSIFSPADEATALLASAKTPAKNG